MIAEADYLLVAILVGVSVFITFFLSSIYYAQRVYDIRRECVEQQQEANWEIIDLRRQLLENAIRDRTMSAMPVGRLIGQDDD